MKEAAVSDHEMRVLVLPPTAKDGSTTAAILKGAGIRCVLCPDLEVLCAEILAGAGAILLTEEAASSVNSRCLTDVLGRQPPWSDLPSLILARGNVNSPAALHILSILGNVTLLERPVRVLALVSAVRSALRARKRQYQIREHLEERARSESRLREADRRKDEFLAMLAHELRNPLAAINGAAQIARRSGSEENREWSQDVIERQVQHLARLIDDLMDVSRITRGKIQLKKVPVDVGASALRAVDSARSLIDARGHRLQIQIPAVLPNVLADPTRLEQILGNLLTNAAKYTEEGGEITLVARVEDAHIVIDVRDTGIGISPEMLPMVFDLFVQGDRTIDRSLGGLGIGLTVVQKLAEMHGGSVSVSSPGQGKGSTFTLKLPAVADSPVEGPLPLEEDDPVHPAGTRVLVVDDNVDSARGLTKLLTLLGNDVRLAEDGTTAIEMARAFRPAVVLLDIGLPGMDGYQVAERLRSEGSLQGICLVAVTGYGEEQALRRSREAGFDHHLVKPLDIDRLIALVAGASDLVNAG